MAQIKEETIHRKTKQGLIALGAILTLIVLLSLGGNNGDEDSILIFVGLLVAYVLPTIIAAKRKHVQIMPIALINILLGWTVIGWIAALIWSVASFTRTEETSETSPPTER